MQEPIKTSDLSASGPDVELVPQAMSDEVRKRRRVVASLGMLSCKAIFVPPDNGRMYRKTRLLFEDSQPGGHPYPAHLATEELRDWCTDRHIVPTFGLSNLRIIDGHVLEERVRAPNQASSQA